MNQGHDNKPVSDSVLSWHADKTLTLNGEEIALVLLPEEPGIPAVNADGMKVLLFPQRPKNPNPKDA
jgi:hypothetical protein